MGGQARVTFAFHFYSNIKEPGAALTRPSVFYLLGLLPPTQILPIKVGPLSSLIISRHLKSNDMEVRSLNLYSEPGSWDEQCKPSGKLDSLPPLQPSPCSAPRQCPSSSQPENRKTSERRMMKNGIPYIYRNALTTYMGK